MEISSRQIQEERVYHPEVSRIGKSRWRPAIALGNRIESNVESGGPGLYENIGFAAVAVVVYRVVLDDDSRRLVKSHIAYSTGPLTATMVLLAMVTFVTSPMSPTLASG